MVTSKSVPAPRWIAGRGSLESARAVLDKRPDIHRGASPGLGEVVSFAVSDGQQMGGPSFNYRLKRVAMGDHWAQTVARELGLGR